MRTCWPNQPQRHLAVASVVAAVASAASAAAAVAPTSPPQAKLIGRWTRTVTAADVQRAGAQEVLEGAVCTLTIKATTFRKGPYRGWMPVRSAARTASESTLAGSSPLGRIMSTSTLATHRRASRRRQRGPKGCVGGHLDAEVTGHAAPAAPHSLG
jgi:opacity protein-like surface antigen